MVRKLTSEECEILNKRLTPSEGWGIEVEGQLVGYVFTIVSENQYYVHDLLALPGHPIQVAELFQAVRKNAKELGFENVTFHVDLTMPSMLKFLEKGKAEIVAYVMEMPTWGS